MQRVLLIILVILIGAGAYFLGKNQLTFNKQSQTFYSSPTSNQTTNWKTYSNTEGNFSIQYPSDWRFEETRTDLAVTPSGINSVTFKGKEGELSLGWDEPYGGGGCDTNKIVNLKQISIKGCDDIGADGNEHWGLLTYKTKNSMYLIHMDATAIPSSNANLIRKIFSTLSFTN